MPEQPFDIGYDPFAPETLDDPFGQYSNLRENCPVHRYDGFPGHALYTATRYDDVVRLLTSVDEWSSHYGQMPRYSVNGCLFSDPPEHTLYRKLVQKSFAPRHVARMEPEIERLVHELLDEVAMGEKADLHDALACPLPVLVIAKILGVPTADLEQFKQWSDDQLEAANQGDPDAGAAARRALNDYLAEQLEQRRIALRSAGLDCDDAGEEVLDDVLPDDVISGLLLAEVEGRRLDQRELLVILNQLLVGGNETTTSLITNLFWRILDEPDLAERIRHDRTLDAVAVEESLRLDAPVLGLYRTAVGSQSIGGVDVEDKAKIMATFGAANRDPDVFTDPDEFLLDRDPEQRRRHVAFGLGHHFCPGAHLSRLEARVALRLTLDRFPHLKLDGPTTRIAPFLLWGRRFVPVTW